MSVEVRHGDCLDVMAAMEPNSIDTVITDPPYALTSDKRGGTGDASVNLSSPAGRARVTTGFMGKGWDGSIPDVRYWSAALRVAKPGATLLAFGGDRTHHRLMCAIEDAGWQIRTTLAWIFGSGFPKSHNFGDKVKDFAGYGTALKPAFEIIIMAMKPLDGTFAENAQKWGVAGLHIDGGRIEGNYATRQRSTEGGASIFGTGSGGGAFVPTSGRWPANLSLDEDAAAALDEQSGESTDGVAVQRHGGGQSIFRKGGGMVRDDAGFGGQGGASRFFYVAKASNGDRGHESGGALPLFGEGPTERRNTHPTVKPTALMEWLCKLTRTPTGGLILDPFAGSGSTLVAAKRVGRPAIGIELEAEYVEIARRRLGL